MPGTVVGCHLLCLGSCLARGVVLQLFVQTYHRLLSAFWHFYNQCLFNSFRQVIWLECESKVLLCPWGIYGDVTLPYLRKEHLVSHCKAHSTRLSSHLIRLEDGQTRSSNFLNQTDICVWCCLILAECEPSPFLLILSLAPYGLVRRFVSQMPTSYFVDVSVEGGILKILEQSQPFRRPVMFLTSQRIVNCRISLQIAQSGPSTSSGATSSAAEAVIN